VKNVAVLGCGPTGLLVAHAVEQAGHVPHIISKKVKSDIPGSQHLHGPVPGLTSKYPEGAIQFVRLGTAEGYAHKVYGDATRETGWDNYLQLYPSWNIITAYDKLWERFESEVTDCNVTIAMLPEIIDMYDAIISTIPQQALCVNESHVFTGSPYFIERLPTPPADEQHEIVVYNGLPTDPWYRWSILGGLCSIEYPFSYMPPKSVKEKRDITDGWKAIDNNCDCWPDIWRCGRWAEWRHGVTMYKSYLKAVQMMEAIS
jgi:hypothetical protein